MPLHLRLNGQTAPLLMLPGHDRLLYDPATTAAQIEAAVAGIAPADGSPWHVAFWAMHNRERCAFVPWEDDDRWAQFCANLSILRDATRERGGGVYCDLELYLWTPGMGGGKMRAPAWEYHPRISERAAQYADALAGIPFGVYVATGELPRLKGLRKWTRTLADAGARLLCECYTGHCAHPRWAQVIPGKLGGPSVLARRKRDGWAWQG